MTSLNAINEVPAGRGLRVPCAPQFGKNGTATIPGSFTEKMADGY